MSSADDPYEDDVCEHGVSLAVDCLECEAIEAELEEDDDRCEHGISFSEDCEDCDDELEEDDELDAS